MVEGRQRLVFLTYYSGYDVTVAVVPCECALNDGPLIKT